MTFLILTTLHIREFRLQLRCVWGLRSSGMLRSATNYQPMLYKTHKSEDISFAFFWLS